MFWRGYKYLVGSNLHHAFRRDSVDLSKEISERAFSQPVVDAVRCLGSHRDGVTPGAFWNMTSCRYGIVHGYQYSGRIFCISACSKMETNFSIMKEIKSRNMMNLITYLFCGNIMNSKSRTSLKLTRYLLYVLYLPLGQVAKEF
jgi:hypothetical protein